MSKISKEDYYSMADKPDNVQVILANTLGEGYTSESLLTLRKTGNRVKSQFSFGAVNSNTHPLTHAFLIIDGAEAGKYTIKPPVADIATVKALDMEWEV